MITNHLRTQLKQHYSISPDSIEPVGTIYKRVAVYKVQTGYKTLCLKPFAWDRKRFKFFVHSLHYLKKKNYPHSPILYTAMNESDGFEYRSRIYYLTDWYSGGSCNFSKEADIRKAVHAVATLHATSKQYAKVKRIKNEQFLQLIRRHQRFRSQVEHLRKVRNVHPDLPDSLEKLVQPIVDGDRAIAHIQTFLTSHVYRKYLCLCHNDLTSYNLLLDNKGEVKLIDFDNCRISCSIQEISSFLANTLHWSPDKMEYALNEYDTILRLSSTSLRMVYAYLLLPREVWHFTSQLYRATETKKQDLIQTSIENLQQTLQSQPNKSSCLTKMKPFLMR